jgi:hypothetical protein
MIFVSFSIEKKSPGFTMSPSSHLTCTSTKSNLDLANSQAAAVVFELLLNEKLRYLCEAR